MENRYLTDSEIEQMALAAYAVFEQGTPEYRFAARAAREYAVDDLGVRPSNSAVLLAANKGRAMWESVKLQHTMKQERERD